MKFDYKDKDASKDEIYEFAKSIYQNTNILQEDRLTLSYLLNIWTSYILKSEIKQGVFEKIPFIRTEYFPLEHNIMSYETVMYFNITNVNILIQNDIIPTSTVMLSQCINCIHYTKHEDKELRDNEFSSPVIIAEMFSQTKDNKITHGEVIDGNHRVSASVKSNVDIPVTIIESMFIPPFAFRNYTSWALYHLITGMSILLYNRENLKNQDDYLKQLEAFLNYNYNIQ